MHGKSIQVNVFPCLNHLAFLIIATKNKCGVSNNLSRWMHPPVNYDSLGKPIFHCIKYTSINIYNIVFICGISFRICNSWTNTGRLGQIHVWKQTIWHICTLQLCNFFSSFPYQLCAMLSSLDQGSLGSSHLC